MRNIISLTLIITIVGFAFVAKAQNICFDVAKETPLIEEYVRELKQ